MCEGSPHAFPDLQLVMTAPNFTVVVVVAVIGPGNAPIHLVYITASNSLVSRPYLVHIYHFHYNILDTKSNSEWGWFRTGVGFGSETETMQAMKSLEIKLCSNFDHFKEGPSP